MQKMVTVEKIKEIKIHENADLLELAYVKGWQVCVQKGLYKEGDIILYFAVDSILPQPIEEKIFGEGAKVTLKKSRVRTIKLRGAYSQGLIAPIDLFSYRSFHNFREGMDFTREFGVEKFEPKINKGDVLYTGDGKKVKRTKNPNFFKVRKPQNIKNYPEAFMGKEVVITEKIHGSSWIGAWVKRPGKTFFEKLTRLILGEYEFCYRSKNVQLQRKDTILNAMLKKFGVIKNTMYYNTNIYVAMCKKYNIANKLPMGYEVTGEIYGSGIQKGYNYDCKDGERKLVIYGVRKDGKNLPHKDAVCLATKDCGLDYVPVLFEGILTPEVLEKCTNGKSALDPKTKVREGCVVELKEANGENVWLGAPVLKSISEKYLLKDNTDYH